MTAPARTPIRWTARARRIGWALIITAAALFWPACLVLEYHTR